MHRRPTRSGAWRHLAILATVVVVVLGACTDDGSTPGTPESGSESHFLRTCSETCEGGYACLCGVCTLPCDAGQARSCEQLAPGAMCVEEASRRSESCDVAGPGRCDLSCTTDADCRAIGPAWSCRDTFCRGPSADGAIPGTGGATGTAGSSAGGSGSGPDGFRVPGVEDGELTLDELCDAHVAARCHRLFECDGAPEAEGYGSLDHCLAAQPCPGLDALRADADAGVLQYDGAAAATCYGDVCGGPFAAGENLFDALAACGAATGTGTVGATCRRDLSCAGALRCTGTCPGTCTDVGVGTTCDVIPTCRGSVVTQFRACSPCAEGLACMADGTCQAPLAAGQPCSGTLECGSDGWCDQTGVCRPLGTSGEPCQADNHCQAAFVCLPTNVCGAPLANGLNCNNSRQCESGECRIGRCVEPAGAGAFCDATCASGFVCSGGECRARRYPGDACDADGVCQESYCVDGTCALPLPLGAPCTFPTDCTSDYCPTGGTGTVCVDPIGCP